jgi:hypothetical protein
MSSKMQMFNSWDAILETLFEFPEATCEAVEVPDFRSVDLYW